MDTAQLRADFDRDGYVVCRGASMASTSPRCAA